VHVYRLVTEGTVEERLIARAEKKLYLDMMVIGQSRLLKEGNLVCILGDIQLIGSVSSSVCSRMPRVVMLCLLTGREVVQDRDLVHAHVRRGSYLPRIEFGQ